MKLMIVETDKWVNGRWCGQEAGVVLISLDELVYIKDEKAAGYEY